MAEGELEYARVQDNHIDDAWGVFNDGDLVAVVDTETMAARLCAAEEMLEALKEILEWGRNHTSPIDKNSPHAILVKIHTAVEKATVSEREPCPHYEDNQGFCHKCGILMNEDWARQSGYFQEGMAEGK